MKIELGRVVNLFLPRQSVCRFVKREIESGRALVDYYVRRVREDLLEVKSSWGELLTRKAGEQGSLTRKAGEQGSLTRKAGEQGSLIDCHLG